MNRYNNRIFKPKKSRQFDSQLELNFYTSLCKFFNPNNIKIHEDLILISRKSNNDSLELDLKINIDFVIDLDLENKLYFEVKGVYDEKFKRQLTELWVLKPEIVHFYFIVFSDNAFEQFLRSKLGRFYNLRFMPISQCENYLCQFQNLFKE